MLADAVVLGAELRAGQGAAPAPTVTVVQARAEQLEQSDFDVAPSRATFAPGPWLERGAVLAPRGEVWVLLAREPAPSLAGWALVREVGYRWPLTGAERRAVCFRAEGS